MEGVVVVAAVGVGGQAEGDEGADVAIGMIRAAAGLNRHGCAEAETGEENREMKLAVQPVEGGVDVFDCRTAVVLAFTQAGTAEVEAKYGEVEAPCGVVHHFHGVVDDFVVKRATVERMGMADEGG